MRQHVKPGPARLHCLPHPLMVPRLLRSDNASTTIAAANQVAGGTSSGIFAFAAGDFLTINVTGVGTTPGKGLTAELKGLC